MLLFPIWSIEKLAPTEAINMLNWGSIFAAKAREHSPKKVSPDPTVSLLVWLKAGQESVSLLLELFITAPSFPLVMIIFSAEIFFLIF